MEKEGGGGKIFVFVFFLHFLFPGYLFTGLIFLVFTLSVFYEIPQLNLGNFFLMESDEMMPRTTKPEENFGKSRWEKQDPYESSISGLKYTQN